MTHSLSCPLSTQSAKKFLEPNYARAILLANICSDSARKVYPPWNFSKKKTKFSVFNNIVTSNTVYSYDC